MDEELNKAAEEYAKGYFDDCSAAKRAADHGFIAGAKWQAEQDKETIELAEDHAYLAGAVNEREKMLKDAVEGVICKDEYRETAPFYYIESELFNLPHNMITGDKVRIIIVKED